MTYFPQIGHPPKIQRERLSAVGCRRGPSVRNVTARRGQPPEYFIAPPWPSWFTDAAITILPVSATAGDHLFRRHRYCFQQRVPLPRDVSQACFLRIASKHGQSMAPGQTPTHVSKGVSGDGGFAWTDSRTRFADLVADESEVDV